MKKLLIIMLILIALGGSVLAAGYYWLTGIYAQQASTNPQTIVVDIPAGIGGKEIAQRLEAQAVIPHASAFRALSLLNGLGKKFQAGEYAFTKGMTPLEIMQKLARGEVVQHQITIREGLTSAEIMALVTQNPVLADSGERIAIAEGEFLPETYRFTKGTSRQQLLQRMQKAQQDLLAELWPERDTGLPLTTPQEALILASIIEKETGITSERTEVAAVYINRLKIGMPLQADPTVAYGIHGNETNPPPLTLADLKTPHPYNTYLNKGLPPTPICNAGRDAIYAALHPAESKNIYFVATGNGGHRFAKTLDQHNENVKLYRAHQRSQLSVSVP